MTTDINQVLADHPLFGTLSDAHREILANNAKLLTPEAGHYLLVADNAADSFYLIESGELMVEHATSDGETTNIEALGKGEIVGWSWLIPPYKWQFDALVTQSGRIWCFEAEPLRQACNDDPAFGFELALRITHTLVHRLQSTRVRVVEEAAR